MQENFRHEMVDFSIETIHSAWIQLESNSIHKVHFVLTIEYVDLDFPEPR